MQEVFGGESGRRGLRYLARDDYYRISLWDIFLLDVFTATIIIIATTIKAPFFTKHVWVCMNECRSRGDRGILPPLILLIVPLSTLLQSS